MSVRQSIPFRSVCCIMKTRSQQAEAECTFRVAAPTASSSSNVFDGLANPVPDQPA
jgi:hypothetical protein